MIRFLGIRRRIDGLFQDQFAHTGAEPILGLSHKIPA
jgi:hypothetical protein